MRVLLDCTYLRNRSTGVDVYFINLIQNILSLDSKNHYIILLDTRYTSERLEFLLSSHSNYRIKRLFSPLPLQVIYSSFLIPFYLRFKKFDVYHNPYFFGPLLKQVCKKTKVVITVHDLYHRTVPSMMNRYLNLVFSTFADNAIKLADKVIVISNQTQTDVQKYLKIQDEKLCLIPQAANFTLASKKDVPPCLEKFDLQKENYILTVGKILPSKGLDDLIKAFKIFKDLNPNSSMQLVSAGIKSGDFAKSIEHLIKSLNLELSVKLLGYLEDDEVCSLFRDSKLIVCPSHYEGFGLPVVEAMSFNRPIIARNTSSLIEVVGNAGVLFNTIDELASQIQNLCHDNELYKSLVKKGISRSEIFSWRETANKTLKAYFN